MQHWPHPAWRSGAHVCYCADTQRLRRESPITDAISWTLDERPFGGRSRASASGETVWVSQTCCYNYHINHPRQHAHALLHKTCTFRNSELSDTFFRSTCERTYFCLASLRKAVCPEQLLGQPRVDRVERMNLVYLEQLRRKRKKEDWQFIQGSYLTTGLLNGHCFSIWWVYSRYKPPVTQK